MSAPLTRGEVRQAFEDIARLLSVAQHGSRASAWAMVLQAQRKAEEYAQRIATLAAEKMEPGT
jgi:hypothetical protein